MTFYTYQRGQRALMGTLSVCLQVIINLSVQYYKLTVNIFLFYIVHLDDRKIKANAVKSINVTEFSLNKFDGYHVDCKAKNGKR